jgi:hypothetical protein
MYLDAFVRSLEIAYNCFSRQARALRGRFFVRRESGYALLAHVFHHAFLGPPILVEGNATRQAVEGFAGPL